MAEETLNFGLPIMRHEPGERRAFLPAFVARLVKLGANVALEEGYGSGLGLAAQDYLKVCPDLTFVSREAAYAQDYVLVLRCPNEASLQLMRRGACLITMAHYPTRPGRVQFLNDLGLEAISLDSVKDDSGRRLIENLRAVAWNGVQAAMQTLARTYPHPGFASPRRPPLRVTLLGAGAVGSHVMRAVVRYGDEKLRNELAAQGVPGVRLTVADYDLAGHAEHLRALLCETDLLVDATQRPDPSRPVVPNAWLADVPAHAVLLDLSVDPYDCDSTPRSYKGLEGIPHGNLDQYVFGPDDPAFDTLPPCVDRRQRRWSVSCYSWPGVHPRECMEVYGNQLRPVLRTLIERGGIRGINPRGRFFERAIARAQLSRWA